MASHRSLQKRLLKLSIVRSTLAFCFSLFVRLIFLTARVEKTVPEAAQPYIRGEKPAVFCFWHGRMVMMLMIKPPTRGLFVLSSHHTDGSAIVAVMRWFAMGTVRGSTSRGSATAVRNLLQVRDAGDNIAFTPDGPRGPLQKAAPGAAYVAAKTGYPLVPIAFSATRYRRFKKSWDQFMLPKLFSRLVYVVSDPIIITDDGEEAVARTTALLEAALNTVTAEADRRCAVVP